MWGSREPPTCKSGRSGGLTGPPPNHQKTKTSLLGTPLGGSGGREFELKLKFKFVFVIVGNFYGKLMEKVCLKAPGSYASSFWTGHFLVLLLENPQTSLLVISGFGGLVGTLIYGFDIPKYSILILYNRIIH